MIKKLDKRKKPASNNRVSCCATEEQISVAWSSTHFKSVMNFANKQQSSRQL